jgi:hypothetical protein
VAEDTIASTAANIAPRGPPEKLGPAGYYGLSWRKPCRPAAPPYRPCRASVVEGAIGRLLALPHFIQPAYSSIGPGRPIKYPCNSSQPSRSRKATCASVSTPSAMTGMLRPCESPRTARIIAAAFGLLSILLTNERSILILSNGKDYK